MSTEALNWAWKYDAGSPGRKLVLVAIADGASEEGVTWPSYRFLATKTGLSADTIRQYVRDFEAAGVIEKRARARENGSSSSNEYRLVLGPPLELEPHPPGAGTPPPPGAGAPPLHVEPPEGTLSEPGAQTALMPNPMDELWEHWCLRRGKPEKITDQHRGIMRNALKVRPLADCLAAIDGLFADPWWRERVNPLRLGHALKGNSDKGETVGDRIDMMVQKAVEFAGASPASDLNTFVGRIKASDPILFDQVQSHVQRVTSAYASDQMDRAQSSLTFLAGLHIVPVIDHTTRKITWSYEKPEAAA